LAPTVGLIKALARVHPDGIIFFNGSVARANVDDLLR
jgi:hypothetical protein